MKILHWFATGISLPTLGVYLLSFFLVCMLASCAGQQRAPDLALFRAAHNGDLAEVTDLLMNGADVNFQQTISKAIPGTGIRGSFGFGAVAPLYIYFKGGETVLMAATIRGHLDVVRYLVEKGAKLDTQDDDDATALFFAIKYKHLELARYLMESGADTNVRDENDNTLLIFAVSLEYDEIIQSLLAYGADIDMQGKNDTTALMLASQKGFLDIARYLVEKGADLDIQDDDNDAALTWAVCNGHIEIVQFLVEKGADVTIKNKFGKTPLPL